MSKQTIPSDDIPVELSGKGPTLEWTLDAQKRQIIGNIRARFLEQYNRTPELYDELDVAPIRDDDWQIQRFVLRCNGDPDRTVSMIQTSLKWKKENELARLGPHLFSRDFYQAGALFHSLPDKRGRPVLFIRMKYHRKIKELDIGVFAFVLHHLYQLDKQSKGKGTLLVVDWEGYGYQNVDMQLAWKLSQAIVQHYPYGRVIALQLSFPRWLIWFWKLVKSWIPDDFARIPLFIEREQIFDYIDRSNVPYYLGGDSPLNYHAIPADAASDEDLVKSGYVDWKSVDRIRAAYVGLIEEAKRETELIKQKHGDRMIDGFRYETPS